MITHIINLVIRSNTIPSDWKTARVTPIYKEGNREDPNNYQPISVWSVIAKIFEKVIFDQTYKFLCDNKVLSESQSGFRPLHSTSTTLLEITEKWYTNMDNGLINAILFVDLKKAFDTINYDILLNKLSCNGFTDKTIRLFRNYLTQRTQVTFVNNVPSNHSSVICGVPQGSILGPLSFLLYVNDLSSSCDLLSDEHLYADDTTLTYADNDFDQILTVMNKDLHELDDWLNKNKLSLNVIKTKCMFIGTRQKLATLPSQPAVEIDGYYIEKVKNFKCLGLNVDETLMWDAHIATITSKIAKVISVLRRLKSLLPHHVLVTVYKSLILPQFDYCSRVWGNLGKGLAQKLQKLQNCSHYHWVGLHYTLKRNIITS